MATAEASCVRWRHAWASPSSTRMSISTPFCSSGACRRAISAPGGSLTPAERSWRPSAGSSGLDTERDCSLPSSRAPLLGECLTPGSARPCWQSPRNCSSAPPSERSADAALCPIRPARLSAERLRQRRAASGEGEEIGLKLSFISDDERALHSADLQKDAAPVIKDVRNRPLDGDAFAGKGARQHE